MGKLLNNFGKFRYKIIIFTLALLSIIGLSGGVLLSKDVKDNSISSISPTTASSYISGKSDKILDFYIDGSYNGSSAFATATGSIPTFNQTSYQTQHPSLRLTAKSSIVPPITSFNNYWGLENILNNADLIRINDKSMTEWNTTYESGQGHVKVIERLGVYTGDSYVQEADGSYTISCFLVIFLDKPQYLRMPSMAGTGEIVRSIELLDGFKLVQANPSNVSWGYNTGITLSVHPNGVNYGYVMGSGVLDAGFYGMVGQVNASDTTKARAVRYSEASTNVKITKCSNTSYARVNYWANYPSASTYSSYVESIVTLLQEVGTLSGLGVENSGASFLQVYNNQGITDTVNSGINSASQFFAMPSGFKHFSVNDSGLKKDYIYIVMTGDTSVKLPITQINVTSGNNSNVYCNWAILPPTMGDFNDDVINYDGVSKATSTVRFTSDFQYSYIQIKEIKLKQAGTNNFVYLNSSASAVSSSGQGNATITLASATSATSYIIPVLFAPSGSQYIFDLSFTTGDVKFSGEFYITYAIADTPTVRGDTVYSDGDFEVKTGDKRPNITVNQKINLRYRYTDASVAINAGTFSTSTIHAQMLATSDAGVTSSNSIATFTKYEGYVYSSHRFENDTLNHTNLYLSGGGATSYQQGSITIKAGTSQVSNSTQNELTATIIFSVHSYTITYNNTEGATISPANPTTYTVLDEITLSKADKRGYIFNGWTGSNGSTPSTAVSIPKGSLGDKTYTANFTIITYNISYNLNGGTVSTPNKTTYTVEDNFTLNNPTKTGYTFKGWTGSGLSNNTITHNISNSIGDLSFTANFDIDVYNITYNLNGGSATNQTTYTYTTPTFTLSEPSKKGYVFTGWTGSNGSTPQKGVQITQGSTGNKNFTANYDVVEYTITYDLGGGYLPNGLTNRTEYTVNDTFTLNKPTRDGYGFEGWYSNSFSGLQKEVTISNSAEHLTFTAQWGAIKYNITYNLDGGSVSSTNPTEYTADESITLYNPTKKGHEFLGWTGSNGSTPSTSVTIPVGSYGDKNYTANWEAKTYTITYELNGGALPSGKTNPTSYKVTDTFTLNNPEKTGYTFAGWSGTGLTGITNLEVIVSNSDTHLSFEANWKPLTYAITYVNSVDGLNRTEYTPDTETFSLTNPEKVGYKFLGWSGTGLTGTTNQLVTITKGSTGNREYTAHWEAQKYTITYELNGGALESGKTNPSTYTIEDSFTLNNPKKDGFDFVGWSGSGITGMTDTKTIAKGTTGNLSFTANYDGKSYKIEYVLNGGTNASSNPATYKVSSSDISIAEPNKTGSNFLGWSGTNLSVVTKDLKIKAGTYGDLKFIAEWEQIIYTITYDYAGGTEDPSHPKTYTYGTTTTISNPSKTGYSFAGWSSSSFAVGEKIKDFSLSGWNVNLELTANWTLDTYTITYDYNGASEIASNPKEYNVHTATFTLTNPTKSGFTFTGWTGTGLSVKTMTVTVTQGSVGPREYKANFEASRYTITYLLNGGTNPSTNPDHYYYGDSISISAPEKEGFDFLGWSSEKINGLEKEFKITPTTIEDIVLEANFGAKKYQIEYVLDGGSISSSYKTEYTVEDDNYTVPDAQKTGYEFKGWTCTLYEGAKIKPVVYKGTTGNLIFTATYEIISYNVTYDYDGGTAVGNKDKYTVVDTFTLVKPTKDGYEFKGYIGSNGDTPEEVVTISKGSTGDLSFTAIYGEITYDLTYELNGGQDPQNPESFTVTTPTFTLTNPTKFGYDFIGWTGTYLDTYAEKVTIEKGSTGTRHYVANFKPTEFTITYVDVDGNPVVVAQNPTTYNIEQTVTISNPTRDNYEFKGWTSNFFAGFDKALTFSGETGDKVLTANFGAVTYEITLHLNGGSISGDSETPKIIEYTVEDETFTIARPNKTAYNFTGWTGADIQGSVLDLKIEKGSFGNKIYYASYSPLEYTITYELNGGSTVTQNPTKYTIESNITLENPTKEGYEFKGWTGTDLLEITKEVTISGKAGNREYEALWTAKSYDIVLDLDGGTATDNPTEYTPDDPDITLNNPSKHGYTFIGWIGTDYPSLSKEVKILHGSTGVKEYKAYYEINTYQITYVLNGGVATGNPTSYKVTDNVTLSNPKKEGYEFKYWTASLLTGETFETFTLVSSLDGNLGDLTLTANFGEITYKIFYDLGGGEDLAGNPDSYKITDNDLHIVDPNRTGYEFKGWTGTGLSVATKNLVIKSGSTGNKTFTATWQVVNYNISYELDGGSVQGNPKTYNVTQTVTLIDPTRDGYEFLGWSGTGIESGTLKKGYSFSSSTGDKNFKANWGIKTYAITYLGLEGSSSPENPTSYTYETPKFTLVNPTKTGYKFVGWSGTDITGKSDSVTIEKNSVGDREYTANFEAIKYDIIYDYNGGKIDATNPTKYDITEIVTINNATKDGYEFIGWTASDNFLNGECVKDLSFSGKTGNVTLTANYSAITYDIYYELMGGEFLSSEPTKYTPDSEVNVPNPYKKGFTFTGWTGGHLTSATKDMVIPKGTFGTLTFTAHYEIITYTITYELMGGKETSNPREYNVGQSVTLAEPTRDGYTFIGWSGTDLTGNENKSVTISVGSVGNRTYTAHWDTITYNIKYNLNGGIAENKTSYTADTPTFTINNPTRDGYDFAGWSGDVPSGTMTIKIEQGSFGNKEYTASWTPITYTITYVLNGGENHANNPTEYTIQDKITLSAPTKLGNEFNGWSTSYDSAIVKDLTIENRFGDITVYAHFGEKTYYIYYDYNGGEEVESNPTEFTVSSSDLPITNPSRRGYTFIGWTGTGIDGSTTTLVVKKGSTEDRYYTANWEIITFTIVYELDGGENATGNPETYNVTSNIDILPPSKDNYTFAGWSYEGLVGDYVKTLNTSSLYGNKTLTAHWSAKTFTITYDYNGGVEVSENKTTYTVLTPTFSVINPERVGYLFKGWSGTGIVEGTYATKVTIELGSSGDRNYKANWDIINYDITYNMDGGENPASNPSTYNIVTGITLSRPTKTGYEFLGWTSDRNPNLVLDVALSGITGDITFNAIFAKDVYTIEYILNGAEEVTENPKTYSVTDDDIKIKNPSMKGYTFLGWTGTGVDGSTLDLVIKKGSTGHKTFTANWQLDEYTIKYELNGGINNKDNADSYNVTQSVTIYEPTKEGFTFDGWTGSGLTEKTKTFTIPVGSIGNREYTAQWKPLTYKISYDYNGATTEPENPTGYTPETDTFTLLPPTKIGYTFIGYSGTGLVGNENLNVRIEKGSIGDRSYKAHYTENKYAISYVLNGGVVDGENPTEFYYTQEITLLNPTKNGYDFVGWTCAFISEPKTDVTFSKIADNIEFTANFAPKSYKLTFDLQGGQTDREYPKSYTPDDEDILIWQPTKDGYDFAGWLGADLNNATIDLVIKKGSVGDKNFTANWTAKVYNIEYVLDGGQLESGKTNPLTYTIEDTFTLNNPIKDGFDFIGWESASLDKVTENVTIKQQTGDLKFIAKYGAKTYTITLNLNGGNILGDETSPYVITYTTLDETFNLPIPDKTGYTFSGYIGTDYPSLTKTIAINKGSLGNKEYTAYYDAISYSIEYQLDGGKLPDGKTNPNSYTIEDVILLNNPTKSGYDFIGWTTQSSSEKVIDFTIENCYGDLILTAHYGEREYNIFYDLDGGKLPDGKSNPTKYKVTSNDYTLNNPERVGYDFVGWQGTDIVGAQEMVTIYKGSVGDREYTAIWRAKEYSITYITYGGSHSNPLKYTIEDEITLLDPTLNGYEFKGWTGTIVSEVTKGYTILQGTTGNLEFTAHFDAITYKIEYVLNGGEFEGEYPTSYTIQSSDVTLVSPVKTGYKFVGYNELGDAVVYPTVVIPTGSTGDKTYVCNWEIITYAITYNVDDKTTNNNPTSYTILDKITLNEPTKVGYDFVGWQGTDLNEPTKVVVIENMTGNREYTPIFTEKSYKITYELYGGDLENKVESYFITTETFTIGIPNKLGYDFVGWTESKDGDNPIYSYVITKGTARDITLHANYTPIYYNITYSLDGGMVEVENRTSYTIEDIFTLNNPQKEGYEFDGWTCSQLLIDKQITCTIVNKNGDLHFIANYKPITYTITLNAGDGSVNPTFVKVEFNANYLLPVAEKSGYNFAYWANSENVQMTDGLGNSLSVYKVVGHSTFTAVYTPKEYVITLDAKGGSLPSLTASVKYDNHYTLQVPTKDNYLFIGYYDSENNQVTNASGQSLSPYKVLGNSTYYARYEGALVYVTYDANGGVVNGIQTFTVRYGNEYGTLSTATKNGYEFEGWYKDELLTQKITSNSVVSDGNAHFLYANYTPITYNIDYVLGSGGSMPSGNPYSYTIETPDVTLTDASRDGYKFIGWVGGDYETATKNAVITQGSTGDLTFTAVYEVIEYTISYTLNGGENHADNPTTYTIESGIITLKYPTKTGYTFSYWEGTALDGKVKDVVIPSGSIGNRNYTAYFSANAYTITLNANGGSLNKTSAEVLYGALYKLEIPTRDGYEFNGYFGDNVEFNSQYTDANGDSLTVWNETENRTLYAKWTAKTYKITIDANGGIIQGNSEVYVTFDKPFTLPVTEKEHYVFAGYYLADTDEKITDNQGQSLTDYNVPSDVNVYARWTAKTYTITLNLNGGSILQETYIEYTIESDDISILNPTKDGYDFVGWSSAHLSENTKDLVIKKGSTGDREYTANYSVVTFTIKYILNEGVVDGVNPTTYTVESETFTLLNPTLEGYTFAGWSGTKINGTSKVVTIEKGSTGDREITANFVVNPYYAIRNLMGGDESEFDDLRVMVEYGSSYNLGVPTKNGYAFIGWYDAEINGNRLTDSLGGSLLEWTWASDKEVYAYYQLSPYTITYHLGFESLPTNPTSYTIEDEFTLERPVRRGYTFTGWTGTGLTSKTLDVKIEKGSYGNREYTASWELEVYTIEYNLFGGNAVNKTTYTIDTETFTLNNPTKDGYTFSGWTNESIVTPQKVITIEKGSVGNRTYNAQYVANEYEITLNAEGGNLSSNSKKVIFGENYTLEVPTKAGYEFIGYYDENKTTAYTNLKGESLAVYSDAKDITLHAVWVGAKFDVTFDFDGGVHSVTEKEVTFGMPYGELPTPIKNGYEFIGYYTHKTAGTLVDSDTLVSVESNHTLFARYKTITYKIIYLTDRGTNPLTYTVESDDITLKGVDKLGYTFNKWTGDKVVDNVIKKGTYGDLTVSAEYDLIYYAIIIYYNGGRASNPTTYTIESETITLINPLKDGHLFKNWTELIGEEEVDVGSTAKIEKGSTGNKTFTAYYTARTYEIILNANGGYLPEEDTSKYVTYNKDYTLPIPTRKGYDFVGWQDAISGGNKLTDENGDSLAVWSYLEGKVLYAGWEVITYNISYYLDGGSLGDKTNPLTYTIESEDITLNNPTKDGYDFVGWSGTDLTEDTLVVTIFKGSIGNRTYLAHYTPKVYNITYELNGGTLKEGEVNPSTYTIETNNLVIPYAPTLKGHTFVGWTKNIGDTPVVEYVIAKGSTGDLRLIANYAKNTYKITIIASGITQENKVDATYGENYSISPMFKENYNFLGYYDSEFGGMALTNNVGESLDVYVYDTDIIVYARYEGKQFTVTFDAGLGNTLISSKVVRYGDKYGELPIASRDYYEFIGWTIDSKIVTAEDYVTIESDHTIKANYNAIVYNLTFINGGEEENVSSYTVETETFTLVNPSKTGYDFTGYESDYYSGKQTTVTIEKGSHGDKTFTATYSAIKYTITYHLNGGVVESNPLTYTIESETFTLSKPTKVEYEFEGWTGTDLLSSTKEVTIEKGSTGNREYTATYVPKGYIVTIDANGGEVDGGTAKVKVYYNEKFSLPITYKQGYDFIGYYDSLSQSAKKITDENGKSLEVYPVKADSRVYAHFTPKTFNITIDLNGGDLSSVTSTTKQVLYGEHYNLEVPTCKGYTFVGYSTSAENGTFTTDRNGVSILPYTLLEDSTVYAIWTPNKYKIYLSLNGESVDGDKTEIEVTFGSTYSLPIARKTGYTFGGYYELFGGNGERLTDEYGTCLKAYDREGDLTVYPYMQANKYTIVFNVNGGQELSITSQEVTFGENYSLPVPQKQYSMFVGWYDEFGVKMTTSTGSSIIPYHVAKNSTYNAQYEALKFNVTLDVCGGDELTPSVYKVSYMESYTLPVPTFDGYDFMGWFDGAENGIQYTNKNGESLKVYDELNAKTLYAVWISKQYALTLDLNGGSLVGAQTTKHVTFNTNYTLPVPSKDKHVFTGWALDSLGANMITGENGESLDRWTIAEDRTVYAIFEEETAVLLLDVNGGDALVNDRVKIKINKEYELEVPTRTGYEFVGWFNAKQNGVQYADKQGNSMLTFDEPIYLLLFANWKPLSYKATLDVNGGNELIIKNIYVTYDTEYLVQVPTKADSIFGGYYDAIEGGNQYTFSDGRGVDVWKTASDITLYARWYAVNDTVDVIFDPNGGECKTTSNEVKLGGTYGLMPIPTKNGYNFVGWYSQRVGGVLITKDTPLMQTIEHTLYARYTLATYTITYNLGENAGSSSILPSTYTFETDTFTISEPTRNGYKFVGFTGTGLDGITKSVTIYKGSYGNREYVAVWELERYTITYRLYGGSAINVTYYTIESDDITLNNPSKIGYEFDGWTGTHLLEKTKSVTILKGSTGNRMYVANYDLITYNIEYLLNGGVNDSKNPLTYTIESEDIVLLPPSKDGTGFVGFTGTNLTGITREVIIKKGSIGDRRYTAIWSSDLYEVKLEYGNALGITKNTYYLNENDLFSFEVPIKEHFTFLGWKLKDTDTMLTDSEGRGLSVWTITSNVTVEPKWQGVPYTIYFNANGGEVETTNKIVTFGLPYGEMPTPTKAGYRFVGWYTALENGEVVDFSTIVNFETEHVLYAIYSKDKIKVTFDYNGGSGDLTEKEVEVGKPYGELPTPYREGYLFKGYFVGNDEEREITSDTIVTAQDNHTLKAKWEKIEDSSSEIVEKKDKNDKPIVLIVVACVGLGLVLIVVIVMVATRKKGEEQQEVENSNEDEGDKRE